MNNIVHIKCRYCTIPVDIVLKQMQPRKWIPFEMTKRACILIGEISIDSNIRTNK